MLYYVFSTRDKIQISNVLACDNFGRSLGKLDTFGEVPKRYLDKTLQKIVTIK